VDALRWALEENDRLTSINDDLITDLGRQHGRLRERAAEVDRLTAELATARATGRREGLEEAAKALDVQQTAAKVLDAKNLGLNEAATCREMARRLRSLAAKVTP